MSLLAALNQDDHVQAKPETTIANDNISAPFPRCEARIFLVEDNPVDLTVVQKILIILGYQPDTAVHGTAALQSRQRIHYDLVFMDRTTTRYWRNSREPRESTSTNRGADCSPSQMIANAVRKQKWTTICQNLSHARK